MDFKLNNKMNRVTFFFAFIGVIAMYSAKAQTFHEDDKEGLRMFLRQLSAEDGKINAEQLGLQINDTLDWQDSETWVEKIEGLVWDSNILNKRLNALQAGSPDFDNASP